jgi:glycosyltransferase involved in cell wall biosynthesis
MKEALVSIIIPSFNRAHLIGETIGSIINQTYTNWECLVIDDGSTDDTEKVVKAYCQKDKRIQLFKRPQYKPKGANACRNYGLEISNGKYVNFFDSDDLMHPDKLLLQIESLEANNKLMCICQSSVFVGSLNNIIGLKSEAINSGQIFDDFLQKKIIIPILAPVFKKSFLVEGGFYFDETLQAGQEWNLFAKIFFICKDYVVLNIPLDYIRTHDDSISGLKNSKKPLWDYFLARYNFYQHYKNKLSAENSLYLERYFLMLYKMLIRQHEFKKAYKLWKMAIVTDKSYTYKQQIQLLFSLLSYSVFKKGDIFLTKVNRWHI